MTGGSNDFVQLDLEASKESLRAHNHHPSSKGCPVPDIKSMRRDAHPPGPINLIIQFRLQTSNFKLEPNSKVTWLFFHEDFVVPSESE